MIIASHLHDAVKRQPARGISPWFFYGAVMLDRFLIAPYSYETTSPEPRAIHQPPPVARTYKEFISFVRQKGLDTVAAQAGASFVLDVERSEPAVAADLVLAYARNQAAERPGR